MGPKRRGVRRRAGAGAAVLTALTVMAALTAGGLAGCGTSGQRIAGAAAWVTPPAGALPSAADSASVAAPSGTPASPTARRSSAAAAPKPAVPAGARTFTIVNADNQTIWVASNRNNSHPLAATGWKLAPGQSTTVVVPSQWGGRIWGRTGCSFDASGHGHCQTGDCGGVFQCVGSGATPATLGEFSLAAWGGLDFYDVSMVDGSNLPMYVNISNTSTKDRVSPTGCSSGGCTRPVACPSGPMQVTSGGQVIACRNACAAFNTDTYCCRGSWAGRDNCVPSRWPVDYTAVFKDAEPYAYSYAFDDSATMSCKGGCDYRVTFGVTP